MNEADHVTKDYLDKCLEGILDHVRVVQREISEVKSAVIDTEHSFIEGDRTVLAKIGSVDEKVNAINGRLRQGERWQIKHDGVEEGRQQVGTGIRNWIILGFGATTCIQAAIGILVYLAAA